MTCNPGDILVYLAMQKSQNTMPWLPGFYRPTYRREARSSQQVLSEKIEQLKRKSFKQLGEIFSHFVPTTLLQQEKKGSLSRRRIFSKENTFWAFFGQVLDADGGCKEVVSKLQSYASLKGMKIPSSSTASYCTARQKLSPLMLKKIFVHTAAHSHRENKRKSLCNRRVIVVDGTGISMPDTAENQKIWPQSASQKVGCGFPTARICACFSLDTGALLNYEVGNKKSSELPLFRKQWHTFKRGDIFLGDKGFCSYYDYANLLQKGVDSVVTLARRTPVKATNALKKHSPNDLLITWKRPTYNKTLSYSRKAWEALPEYLRLRQIKVKVRQPGYRTKEFYIVTTLLDVKLYPPDEIADLYLRRWDVELFFRDIKTTLGLDILRCKTPKMIEKEISMYFIAYNCVRRIMNDAADEANISARDVSFKGSVQVIRNWEPHLNQVGIKRKERSKLLTDLHGTITSKTICIRQGRSEPRCKKRRPKSYQLMTVPRHQMREISHRGRYRAKNA